LSRAIDTLDATVKAFAAFVPVGLVRQLITSGRKLELGGHSRFLTIFFSDLEAFSTLSEEIPHPRTDDSGLGLSRNRHQVGE
jgi:adenylate cyclase